MIQFFTVMKMKKRMLSVILLVAVLCSLLCGCTDQQINDSLQAVSTVVEVVDALTEENASNEAAAPSEENSEEAEPPAETEEVSVEPVEEPSAEETLDEQGTYTSKEDVALYIHLYGHLPDNFVTKSEAEKAGWSGGSLERYLPGKSIGGNRFGNREGLLPDAPGRKWTECDINTLGASSRGAERIVFSNDGLIYYTGNHYESFELLYGEP